MSPWAYRRVNKFEKTIGSPECGYRANLYSRINSRLVTIHPTEHTKESKEKNGKIFISG